MKPDRHYPRRRAIVKVPESFIDEVVRSSVDMPVGYRVQRVTVDVRCEALVLVVEGPDIPETAPAEELPTLEMRRQSDGNLVVLPWTYWVRSAQTIEEVT